MNGFIRIRYDSSTGSDIAEIIVTINNGCPFEFFILSRNNQHPLTERASSECFKRIVTATAGKT
jgi:hypothetical protein